MATSTNKDFILLLINMFTPKKLHLQLYDIKY